PPPPFPPRGPPPGALPFAPPPGGGFWGGVGGWGRRLRLASGLPLSLLVFTLGTVGGGALLCWLT
ncbi:MAG: hypothetical protein QW084_04645, partial [Candidatus Hadarchaeales archaeon]